MKKIYFIVNEVSPNYYDFNTKILINFDDTEFAISIGDEVIYTTSMAHFSFDLLDKGYQIFLCKHNKAIEIKPGMPEIEKDLRKQHNILRLFLAGFFDRCFI